MDELLSHNPGVRSRFPTTIRFDDYSADELEQIARGMLAKASMELDGAAEGAMRAHFDAIAAAGGKESGNGRAVRNVVERALRAQALRLASCGADEMDGTIKPDELCRLTADDFA